MRILFVLEHFYPYIGGAEELFYGLAKALVQHGNHVEVITTRHSSELPAKENLNGIFITRIDCKNRFLFTVMSLPTVFKMAGEADIIHTTSYNAALPASLAGFVRRKKVFITFHEVWGMLWFRLPFLSFISRRAFYLYEKMILSLPFEKFIAVSDFTGNALIDAGIPANKVVRIYNGIDYTSIQKTERSIPQQFTFCYFGRLGVSKGLDLLLPAFRDAVKMNSEIRLKLIIPKYPEKLYGEILEMIEEFNLNRNITLLHDLNSELLLQEVASSSCVVIPSYSEGFCFTAAEATALNVPVITSGRGALREVVGGRHIHLSQLDANTLLMAMKRALNSEWDELPQKAFHFSECIKNYLELYGSLDRTITPRSTS